MPAAATDKFKKLSRRWVGQIGAGAVADGTVTTVPLSSVTNLPTDTGVVIVIDRVDANGTSTPQYEETIIGAVSGTNLINCVRGAEGTAQAHNAGAVVEVLVSAKGWNDLIDGLLISHTQTGALGASVVVASNISASSIVESNLSLSDVTTANVSAAAHGFVPKIPNDATKFFRGDGTYASPSSSGDGWTSSADTWVYVSANSFKITGVDRTATFPKGTRIKFTNNSITVYGTVISAAFSTDTTITLAPTTDYSINNSAITTPFYSYSGTPQGYPGTFSFTPTYGGFSVNPIQTIKFSIIGNMITLFMVTGTSGTSNATTYTMSVPVIALIDQLPCQLVVIDSGTTQADPGYISLSAGSITMSLLKTLQASTWTASGTKGAHGVFSYPF